jgi:hypothetical protein
MKGRKLRDPFSGEQHAKKLLSSGMELRPVQRLRNKQLGCYDQSGTDVQRRIGTAPIPAGAFPRRPDFTLSPLQSSECRGALWRCPHASIDAIDGGENTAPRSLR